MADIAWSADFDEDSAAGLTAGPADGGVVRGDGLRGRRARGTGTLSVAADNSKPDRINIRVVRTPSPSLAPIRVSTLKAGESQTIDLARYLTPGVSDPTPTVVEADPAQRPAGADQLVRVVGDDPRGAHRRTAGPPSAW